MTSDELAVLCGVSSKTIRAHMLDIAELMKDSGAELIIKKGQGYTIVIKDETVFPNFMLDLYTKTKNAYPDSPAERIIQLLFQLLDGERVSRNENMEYMVINNSMWNKHLKKLEGTLKSYRLKLCYETKGNDRLYYIEGSEFDRRLCYCYRTNWYGYGVVYDLGGSAREMLPLRAFLLEMLKKHKLLVMRDIFDDLWNSLYVCVLRVRQGHTCELLTTKVDGSEVLNGSALRPVAEEIRDWLEQQFAVTLNEDELLYIQLMLLTKTSYADYLIKQEVPIPSELIDIMHEFYAVTPDYAYQLLQYSRIQKYELFRTVCSIYLRLKHGIYIFSPHLRKIKEVYPVSYQKAEDIKYFFNNKGRIDMYPEEIAILAMAIHSIDQINNTFVIEEI